MQILFVIACLIVTCIPWAVLIFVLFLPNRRGVYHPEPPDGPPNITAPPPPPGPKGYDD